MSEVKAKLKKNPKGKLRSFMKGAILSFKKICSFNVWKNTFRVVRNEKIAAYWWRGRGNRNWGDKINPWIISRLSGKDVVHVDDIINFRFINVYSCIGSIVEKLRYNGIHIWGSGIISDTSALKINPKKIHAVRGPSTKARLEAEGFNCPAVYGDPALLLPRLHKPEVEKTVELGIVPHYVDKDNENVMRLQVKGEVMIIDIFGGETEFIDDVNRCKRIVSSSLHGLVVADAYGLPSKWVKLSEKIYGNDFKFGDYYLSIHVHDEKPFIIDEKTDTTDLIEACWQKEMEIDVDQLLLECPFINHSNLSSSKMITHH